MMELRLKYKWLHSLLDFEEHIESGKTELRPIKHLIKHIIKKGYDRTICPGTSMFNLLISLPVDNKFTYEKTLSVSIDTVRSVVKFRYTVNKKITWTDSCQFGEVCDTFDYFISSEHTDWHINKKQNMKVSAYINKYGFLPLSEEVIGYLTDDGKFEWISREMKMDAYLTLENKYMGFPITLTIPNHNPDEHEDELMKKRALDNKEMFESEEAAHTFMSIGGHEVDGKKYLLTYPDDTFSSQDTQ